MQLTNARLSRGVTKAIERGDYGAATAKLGRLFDRAGAAYMIHDAAVRHRVDAALRSVGHLRAMIDDPRTPPPLLEPLNGALHAITSNADDSVGAWSTVAEGGERVALTTWIRHRTGTYVEGRHGQAMLAAQSKFAALSTAAVGAHWSANDANRAAVIASPDANGAEKSLAIALQRAAGASGHPELTPGGSIALAQSLLRGLGETPVIAAHPELHAITTGTPRPAVTAAEVRALA